MSTKRKVRNDESSSDTVETYLAISKPHAPDLRTRIRSATDVYEAASDIRDADREHFVVFDLDARHRVRERRIVHIGTLTGVEVHPREVFRGAIVNCAVAVIICHNHPSGDPTPSRQDLELTTRLREVGELHGIPVLDHVVVAPGSFVSIAERGWS